MKLKKYLSPLIWTVILFGGSWLSLFYINDGSFTVAKGWVSLAFIILVSITLIVFSIKFIITSIKMLLGFWREKRIFFKLLRMVIGSMLVLLVLGIIVLTAFWLAYVFNDGFLSIKTNPTDGIQQALENFLNNNYEVFKKSVVFSPSSLNSNYYFWICVLIVIWCSLGLSFEIVKQSFINKNLKKTREYEFDKKINYDRK